MKPTKSAKRDPVLGDRYTHPAFGMIGISHVSGQATLVGSAVEHQHYVFLEVYEADICRDEYKENFFAKKMVCRLSMSHAQLAEMLFSTNIGNGVPCTLNYVKGDEGNRPEVDYESPMKRDSNDLKAALRQTLGAARDLANKASKLVKRGLSKKVDREDLKNIADRIVQDVESNLAFAARCMDEKVEKSVAHAKAEIESFVELKIRAAGIEHLKAEAPKLLEGKDDADAKK